MRARWTILTLAAGLAAAGSAPAGLESEPFWTQNQSPVSRLYGLPSGDEVPAGEGTGSQVRVAVDVANQSFHQVRDSDELVLDGESWTTRLMARHGWRNGWRLAIQIPVAAHGGGGLDDFLEDYHDLMGLPDGNRKRRPSDRLEYRYRQGGETRFRQTDPTAGLGDVRLSAAAPLWRGRDGGRALDAVAGVELPTGDPDRLLGSGSTDVSLGVAACDGASLSRWGLMLHGSVGLLGMTEGELLPEAQRPVAGYGSASVGWRLADWLQPRLQLDWNSPIFSGTGMTPLDSSAVELVMGATLRLPAGVALDVAVAEDLVVNAASDVVFHFCLWRNL